jgi:hypothetical protein
MLLPLMGLLLFFIPVVGFVAGAFLLCIRRFRFVAPYAFLTPVCSSYSATAGLWGIALGMEHLGFRGWPTGVGALVGFAFGGLIEASFGVSLAGGLSGLVSQLQKVVRR